jgi:flagellar secretion chaperone FliS
MDLSAHEAYLETQVMTATPQRLRLMLIEGALRRTKSAQEAWRAGNEQEGLEAVSRCRNIVSELISGIQPDQTALAKQVLGLYGFIFSTLIEAQLSRDALRLNDVLRVLEEERQTWQAVCEKMPDRPVPLMTFATEELAPQRVSDGWSPRYTGDSSHRQSKSAFSIEA